MTDLVIEGWTCREKDGDRKAERQGCKLICDAGELSIDVRDSGGVEFVPLAVVQWLTDRGRSDAAGRVDDAAREHWAHLVRDAEARAMALGRQLLDAQADAAGRMAHLEEAARLLRMLFRLGQPPCNKLVYDRGGRGVYGEGLVPWLEADAKEPTTIHETEGSRKVKAVGAGHTNVCPNYGASGECDLCGRPFSHLLR